MSIYLVKLVSILSMFYRIKDGMPVLEPCLKHLACSFTTLASYIRRPMVVRYTKIKKDVVRFPNDTTFHKRLSDTEIYNLRSQYGLKQLVIPVPHSQL